MIDYGNPKEDEDDITWVLLETNAKGEHKERIIQALWEDDLADEDAKWDK